MLSERTYKGREISFEIEWLFCERAVCERHAHSFKNVHAGNICPCRVQARPDCVRNIVLCA